MRTKNSLLNVTSNCACFTVLMLSKFVVRKTLSETLGLQYVGIEGRFTDYVSLLTILEFDLGMSFIYKLYDPIAKNDWIKISTIIKFLKNSYIIIDLCIFITGVIFSLFAPNSISENFSKQWLTKIFLLFLLDTVSSYLFMHKKSMITADQKSRIIVITKTSCVVIFCSIQLFILKIFNSFELYIIAKILSRITENCIISYIFDKKYKEINTKIKLKLDNFQKNEVKNSIKAMIFHKIGGAGLTQISTIVFGLTALPLRENGIYCNYMIIIITLWGISSEFFKGIMASFGNLMNTSSKEKTEDNFNLIFLVNFFIYSFFCSSFFCLSTPFMNMWISSENSTFGITTIIALTAQLYIYGMRQSIDMAKSSAGIYVQDRYFPIIECIINFSLSYFLVSKIGLIGTVLGSIFATLSTSFFTHPFYVYKIVFNKFPTKYYKKYFLYTIISILNIYICHIITNQIHFNSQFLNMIVYFIVCSIVPISVDIMFFFKTKEFQKLYEILRSLNCKFLKAKK